MTGPLSGKRIGLLTAAASRRGGGVFEAVIIQAQMIRDLGGEAIVFALEDRYSEEDGSRLQPARVAYAPVIGPAQIGYAPGLLPALLAADLDCLHLHGIWMYPSRVGQRWAQRTGRRYIVSIHGMLNPWITARGRWKKALARAGYERANWRAASALHALTAVEAADIAVATGRSDIIVIPNPAPALTPAPQAMPPLRMLYLGRVHPIKNLDGLIDGWSAAKLPAEARLTLAGWGDADHVADLKRAVEMAGPTVEFLGPVFGQAKHDLLATARFAVLPSLTEGLPMAMLEGWAAGLPTIMTAACNLTEGFAAGASIECGTSGESIGTALRRACALDEGQWLAMSRAAQQLAGSRFATGTVASQWIAAYGEGDLIQGQRP